jgi:hypothetical protein
MLEFLKPAEVRRSPGSPTVRLRFDDGPMAGREFCGAIRMCSHPTCCCDTVHLTWRSIDTDESFEIALNVEKRSWREHTKGSSNQTFAKRLVDALTDGQWDHLRNVYLTGKEDSTEAFDLTKLKDPHFPEHLDGKAVYDVREVLPYAAPVRFSIKGEEIHGYDAYCSIPGCRCQEMTLCVMRPWLDQNSKKPGGIDIRLSHAKRTIEEVRDYANDPSLPSADILVKAMVEQNPDIWKSFRRRHEEMQMLYRKFQAASRTEGIVRPAPTVGRNDPCPCGSGKKYKKCCLGEV